MNRAFRKRTENHMHKKAQTLAVLDKTRLSILLPVEGRPGELGHLAMRGVGVEQYYCELGFFKVPEKTGLHIDRE